jgi:hypothetical protein
LVVSWRRERRRRLDRGQASREKVNMMKARRRRLERLKMNENLNLLHKSLKSKVIYFKKPFYTFKFS